MLQTFTRSIGDCPSNRAFTRRVSRYYWYEILLPAVRNSGGRWNRPPLVDVVLLLLNPQIKDRWCTAAQSWHVPLPTDQWNNVKPSRDTFHLICAKENIFLIIPRCLHVSDTCFSCHYVVYQLISLPKQMFLPAMIYVCVSSKQKSNEINWRHWQWFQDLIWFSMPGRIQGGILL